MTRKEAMTARESFESWAKKEWNYKPHFIVSRYDKGSHKGEYVDPAIEHAWRAWCFVAAAKDYKEIAKLHNEEIAQLSRSDEKRPGMSETARRRGTNDKR